MKMFPREFPSGRRKKPKRQAERRVYEALAATARRGFVYYEWRRGYQCIELDFAVWVEDLGRFALQVKGGRYLLSDGEWHLKTREGLQPVKSCPLDETKLAALDLHDDIKELADARYNPYVIPVLVFPDMESDPAIESLAKRKGVYVIWGTEHLMIDLAEIIRSHRVSDTLSMERIGREVYAVTDGLSRLAEAGREGTGETTARPTVLSVSVGGRKVLQIRAEEMHLRVRTIIGIGTPQKGSDGRRR